MNRSAYTENRFGLQFDPRTKIVLLILCVISATIASSLLYESVLVFAITVFGCASGKVRKSLFCMAFYGAFYILTLWIRSLENPAMTVECLYVPLLMTASNTAEELSCAAVTRGIENPKPRTCLLAIRFRWRDLVAIVLAVFILILGFIRERMV